MKFLVDESVEYPLVNLLRDLGHDIVSIAENQTGLRDEDVLYKAFRDKRILITNDKDFGELTFLKKLSSVGVILFRLPEEDVESKKRRLLTLFNKYSAKIPGHFVVITQSQIRIRKFPVKEQSNNN